MYKRAREGEFGGRRPKNEKREGNDVGEARDSGRVPRPLRSSPPKEGASSRGGIRSDQLLVSLSIHSQPAPDTVRSSQSALSRLLEAEDGLEDVAHLVAAVDVGERVLAQAVAQAQRDDAG